MLLQVCAALISLASTAFPQTMGTGTVTGTHATGAVVPGVKVTATNLATGVVRSVVTNAQRLLRPPCPANRNL